MTIRTRTTTFLTLAVVALVSLASLSTSQAAIVTNDLGHITVGNVDNATVVALQPVGIGDLLESATAVNYSGGTPQFSSELENINDGLAVSNAGTANGTGNYFVPRDTDETLEFVLDASYDIGQIDVFTLWNAPTDNRTGHVYDIHVSTDGGSGGGNTYNLLASVSLDGTGASGTTTQHIRGVSLTDVGGVLDNGTIQASGINAIRFTFTANPGLDSVFAEIDVYAVVPEPASATLAALSLLGLIGFRRRRNR